jgi:hypothetical protein
MQRSSLLGGALYGLLMGGFSAFNALTDGGAPSAVIWAFLSWAIPGAILFGAAMHLFSRSRWVQRSIALKPEELLAGERVLRSVGASMVVRPSDFGLQKFAFDQLLWLAGMRDREAIGGGLHLTNLRLVFRSHRINRLRGTVSVFLPTITRAEDTSSWLIRRMQLHTGSARLEFIFDEPRVMLTGIEYARTAFGANEQTLLEQVTDPLPALEGLRPDVALERINTTLNRGMQAMDVAEAAYRPLAALAAILGHELFDRSIVARWDRRLQAARNVPTTGSDSSAAQPEHSHGHAHRPPGQ